MAELRLGENIVVPAIVIKEGAEINNQDKTITQNGQYTADEGYTGLGTVTVNVSGGGGGATVPDFSFEKLIGTVDESGEIHYPPAGRLFDFSFTGIKRIREYNWDFGRSTGFFAMFFYSKNVRDVSFPDLEEIGAGEAFIDMFLDCPYVRNVSFPALTDCVPDGLGGLLAGAQQTNFVTLHFRADAKDMIESLPEYESKFDAYSGEPTVLFDL